MVKNSILFFLIVLMFLTAASAVECTQKITADQVLTRDLACDGAGIVIDAARVTLDCNGKTIQGKGLGSGVEILGSSVTVKNCNIKGFENGILITHASNINILDSQLRENLIGANIFSSEKVTLTANEITDNSFYGIYSKDSSKIDKDDNVFGNNRQNYYELQTQEPGEAIEEPIEQIETEPQIPAEPKRKEQREQKPSEPREPEPVSSIRIIPMNLPEEIAKEVDAQKTVTISKDKTEYDIEITPKKDFKNIQVTEHIPKEVAKNSEEIHANMPFKVIEEGTTEHGPVIRFDLANAQGNEKRVVSYAIDREALSEFVLRPTTFLLLEAAINPGALMIIRVLFSLVMILFAIWLYLSKILHTHHHYIIHLAVFIACIIIFILFNIKVEIVISEYANNLIVTTVLSILAVILIINNIRYVIKLKSVPKEKREIDELEF